MIKKREFVWNTIGSIVYSIFNAVILLFCTRMNGTEIAGIFSICYATGCILNAIGDLGIRIVQTTDTDRKHKYQDYFCARLLAILAMIVVAVIFAVITGYTNEKLFIFCILIAIRILDNFSETFQAELQLNNRLDLSGKALLIRNTIEILTFIIFDKITNNIYISFFMMLVAGILSLIIYEMRNIKKYVKYKINIAFNEEVKSIIKETVPLGISTLVNMYVLNAVKYAIDRHGNNTMQTYFNILYMPAFVINLISLLLIKPFLKTFGEYWNNHEYDKFIKLLVKLNIFLLVCTVFIELVCAFLGIPILNLLYKVEFNQYKIELIVMILSGLFYAMSTTMFYALGTIRQQKYTTIAYTVTALLALIISNFLVKRYELIGATISSVAIMVFLDIFLTIIFIIKYNKLKE